MTTTAGALTDQGERRLQTARKLLRQIEEARPPFVRETVLEPLNDLLLEVTDVSTEGGLLAEVHPEADVRGAAEGLARAADDFQTELSLNRPLYHALNALDLDALDLMARRVVELVCRDMRRAGVELGPAEQERVRALRGELVRIGQDFSRNIRDDVRAIELTGPEELEGLPADFAQARPPGPDGRIRITTNYPDYIPFMAYARSSRARRALMTEMQNRAVPQNLQVLERMLAKRHELATLLGYPSWAEYITEDKMSGSAANVRTFIEQARAVAKESAKAELAEVLDLKHREAPGAQVIGDWELTYYLERVKAERLQFDARVVRPYFEYRRVKEAILALTSELFGLTFTPVPDRVWDPSVETFDVTVDGEAMGRISLDMHPREGKFKHAACFPWRIGVGGKELPHFVLVCNFPDPKAQTGPALMEHREVVTFFHEFGHLVHGIVRASVPWVRLGWVSEWDFVEAPSQFLEEWIFDFEVLRRFARHFETGATIPPELVAGLRQARDFGRGLFVQRQLFLSGLSLFLHDRDPHGIDTTKAIQLLARRHAPYELTPGTHLQASFGHLENYTALYYTYMWSLVIAKDLHSAFTRGLMDVDQARRYRDRILAPGGTKPAAQLVEDFLGRPYSFEAFQRWLAPRERSAAAPTDVGERLESGRVRAVVFDFGGVFTEVLDRERADQFEDELGLERGGLESALFNCDPWMEVSAGKITDVVYWERVSATFPRSPSSERARALWAFVFGAQLRLGVRELVTELKRRGFRLALVSNERLTLRATLDGWNLTSLFDLVVVSAEVGLRKPDPAIFRRAVAGLGVAPEACLFIDDREFNVLAARALGMQVIRFESVPQLRAALQDLLETGAA